MRHSANVLFALALAIGSIGCSSANGGGGGGGFEYVGSWTVGRGSIGQIAVGPDGRIWTVDHGDGRISAYDPSGDRDLLVTSYSYGRDVVRPQGVAVSSDNQVYVSEGGSIHQLDESGEFIEEWTLPEMNDPGHLEMTAVDELLMVVLDSVVRTDLQGQVVAEVQTDFYLLHHIAAAPDGTWFALDETEGVGNDRIVHFDADGGELGSWSLDMSGVGLAVGPSGRVFVGGWGGEPRQFGVYSQAGELLAGFDAGVDMPGYLTYVVDLAVGADGQVYLTGIVDSENVIVRLRPKS